MGQLRTRRQLLLASLAAVPLLAGCTVSGSKEQQRLEQQATPTASPAQGPIFTPTAQVTPTGLPTPLSTATPGSTATLRFGITGNSVLTNIYQQLSPTFSKRNPHLTVKTEPLPSNGLEGIKAALAANTAPDVLLLSWDQLSPLATLGGLDDLTALLGAGFLNTSGLFSKLESYATVAGHTLALPVSFDPQVLFYNTDRFSAAGIAFPTITFDWSAFEAAATKLTGGGKWGFVTSTAAFAWLPWVWAAGGALFDDDLAPSTCELSEAPATAGLQRFARLWNDHHGTESPSSLPGGQAAFTSFVSGTAAMAVGSRASLSTLGGAQFGWQVTYLPQGPGGHGVTYTCTLAGVSHSSRDPLAASSLVSFLATDATAQTELAKSGIVVPALRTAATSKEFAFATAKIDDAVFVDTLIMCTQPPRIANWAAISATLAAELAPLWKGTSTAATVAKTAAEKVNILLKSAAATPSANAISIPAPTPTPLPTPTPGPSPTAVSTPKK